MSEISKEQYYDEVTKGGEQPVDEAANEEMQMALKSMDKEEDALTPEERESETFYNLQKAADTVVKCFQMKPGENLVIITDEGVPQIVRSAFIETATVAVGADLRVMVGRTPEVMGEPFDSDAIAEKMGSASKVIFLTSKSRSHSKESRENILAPISDNPRTAELQLRRHRKRGSAMPGKAALFSITRANNIELLTAGAALENVEEMWVREERFFEVFKKAKKIRITTEMGTDITISIKPGAYDNETGKLSKQGDIANFPFGEIAATPAKEGANGVFVVDGVGGKLGATTNNGYLKEPIKVFIENGIAVRMEGGKEAEEFWQYLTEQQEKFRKEHPEEKGSVFGLAELGVGMNAAAFRINEKGEKILPPTQLEAEKALGTGHLALGNNATMLAFGGYGKDDPDYNYAPIHTDQVICDTTIEIETEDGEKIKVMEAGKLLT
jgi:leucyl aminopeptidase (aminopeptidase T)